MERWPRVGTKADWRRFPALAALGLCLIVMPPARAGAHALLDRSDPPAGVALPVDRPPARVSLWFTEPVRVAFNGVAVLDGSNRRVDRLNARLALEDSRRVDVDLGDASQGALLVRWQVTSSDSHIVRGSYWFVVGFAPAPPPGAALLGAGAPTVSWLEVAARWLGFIALSILAGAPFFELLVLRPMAARLPPALHLGPPAATRRPGFVGLAAATAFVLAHLLWAAAQTEAVSGLPIPEAWDGAVLRVVLFDSRFAALWWLRLGLGLSLGALLLLRAGRHHPWVAWLSAALGLCLIISTSLSGHAIGARAWPSVAVAVDALHLAAAALWLGGLAELSLLLPSVLTLASADHRATFLRALVLPVSRVALASVLTLVGTGLFNTWEQAASLKLAITTAYGQTLLVKLALLLPLFGIAAVNRLVIRPRLAAGQATSDLSLPRRFRAWVVAELLMAAALLFTVGLLVSLPPSGQQTLPAPATVARQAGDLRVAFTMDPNWVGVSRFRVTLADREGLPPADVRRVVLTFTMEGMSMGRTNVTMAPRGGGVFEAQGFYVGMPGISQIGAAISRASGADQNAVFRIEVPDLNQKQLAGLRASLGIGPLGLFGVGVGIALALSLVGGWRIVGGRGARPALGGASIALLVGAGLVLTDRLVEPRALLELGGVPPRRESLSAARGRDLYTRQCALCHGEHGVGNGPGAASLLPPPADLTLHTRWHADEQLYWFITHGVAGTSMLGFGDRLHVRERWEIIGHLHELSTAPTATALRPAPVLLPRATPAPAPAPAPPGPPSEASALPVAEGPSGRLVFGADYDNNLWLVRLPDGKPEQLTNFDRLELSSNPAWSPDGKQIAFSYYRLPSGSEIPVPEGTDLYRMNADGSGVRLLAAHDVRGAALQYPAWAAGGASVYVSYMGPTGFAVDRVDSRSGVRSRIIPNAGYPSVSRDGRRLAYVLFPTPEARGQSLWWSAPNGSNPREILGPTVFEKYFGVRFSPDGRRLLFAAVGQPATTRPPTASLLHPLGLLTRAFRPSVAYANGDIWDLWVVDLDGRNLRQLTALSEDVPVGAWSPDGRSVAFLGGGSASSAEAGLAIIDRDGKNLRRVTSQPGHRGVDWAK